MASKFLQRLRESVSATTLPAVQRGGDADYDSDYADLKEAKLTSEQRKGLGDDSFALPDRRYPIPDESHARNALARVAQHGTPEEQAKVKAAVKKKFPAIDSDDKTRESTVTLHHLIREATIRESSSPGVYECTIIQEGCGNPTDANYYTKDALREAVNAGKFEGLRAYLNHPTSSEERERPERDVRYLAGQFREARFVDGNPARVDAKFVPGGMEVDKVRSLLESAIRSPEHRPLVGISIDGYGAAPDTQTVNGRTYNMVREIAHLGSADIVTQTATGGRFRRALKEASLETGSTSRPVTSKEVNMTTAEFQQKVKAANAKLSEAAGLDMEKDGDRADVLTREGLVLLRECSEATIDPDIKIQETIVEKPVAATDAEKDQIAAKLQETEGKLREAQTALETEQGAHKETAGKLSTLESGQAAIKVMRDQKVPDAFREAWFTDVAAQTDEAAMVKFVERKLAERDAILAEFQESVGIEGAGARIPAPSTPAGGDLLALAGVRTDLAA